MSDSEIEVGPVDYLVVEWPPGNDRTWGAWSPLRGRLVPGTAVFVCELA